jgi:hypothetical protein
MGDGDSWPSLSPTSFSLTVDATAGEVQLDETTAWGVVTGMQSGSVTLNLKSLGGFPVSLFNFAGTGSPPSMGAAAGTSNDATPGAYVISIPAGLSLTGVNVGSPLKVVGFVAPFGAAPPDFMAQTVVNFSAVTDYLALDWGRMGSTTAITVGSGTSPSLQLGLTGLSFEHFIAEGPLFVDVSKLTSLSIADAGASNEAFAIGHAGMEDKTDNFSDFASFATQLTTDLNGTTPVIAVSASGSYNASTGTFSATHIVVLLGS